MPPSAARSSPPRSVVAPVNAPFTWPNKADIAWSPRIGCAIDLDERAGNLLPLPLQFVDPPGELRLACPGGPVSRSGALLAITTRSMRSTSRLNSALWVVIPDFRNEVASSDPGRIASPADRTSRGPSRSSDKCRWAPPDRRRAGGEHCRRFPGRCRDSVSRNRQICATCVPVVMWMRYCFGIGIEGVRPGKVVQGPVHLLEIPRVFHGNQMQCGPRFRARRRRCRRRPTRPAIPPWEGKAAQSGGPAGSRAGKSPRLAAKAPNGRSAWLHPAAMPTRPRTTTCRFWLSICINSYPSGSYLSISELRRNCQSPVFVKYDVSRFATTYL